MIKQLLPILVVSALQQPVRAVENTAQSPYLDFSGVSAKSIARTAAGSPYESIGRAADADTLMVIALRVEFAPDSNDVSTGCGLFGIWRDNKGTRSDIDEWERYPKNLKPRASYTYDDLPHDSLYFAGQLAGVKDYFATVSGNRFVLEYRVFPAGKDEKNAYTVPHSMVYYSPGAKFPEETYNDYYYRRTKGLMQFVQAAIASADTAADSPLRNLSIDSLDKKNTLWWTDPADTTIKKKAAVLIFHAGSSYLTDGGYQGIMGQNSPSDIIDVFMSRDFFDYYADTVSGIVKTGSTAGLSINKTRGNAFILDELMLCSETSNQDSLNWGIRGVLANQIARQIGIPDLFSTTGGISGVGGFCVMDFAGYSAGQGFVPPWPSAWVRAHMGWDTPVIAAPGTTARLKALECASLGDTTMLLIPINNHEYYLLENRQRNIFADTALFKLDTAQGNTGAKDTLYISPFNRINLAHALQKGSRTSTPPSITPYSVLNYDAALPASGVLVWHIDEDRIRDRIDRNYVNADSGFRAVNLVEADGITDLGVMYRDVFYNPSFDYGGAEDVFPHKTTKDSKPVSSMGPFTRPATKSNDGGQTALVITIDPSGKPFGSKALDEFSRTRTYFTTNTPDSFFVVSVNRDTGAVTIPAGWPIRLADCGGDPLPCDIYSGNGTEPEIAVVDTAGRLFVTPLSSTSSLGSIRIPLASLMSTGDSLRDTVICMAEPGHSAGPISLVNGELFIPTGSGIHVIGHVDSTSVTDSETITLPAAATTATVGTGTGRWAQGCENGSVVFGNGRSISGTIRCTKKAIQAIASLDTTGLFIVIDSRGMLYTVSAEPAAVIDSLSAKAAPAPFAETPDYKMAAGDLDRDGSMEIAILDERQRLTVRRATPAGALSVPEEWENRTVDIATLYRADTSAASMPRNHASLALADVNGDGYAEILIPGSNGIFACNFRGVSVNGWPALLDRYYSYQKGSIKAPPVVGMTSEGAPRTIFSSPTGDQVTYTIARIDSTNPEKTTIYFTRKDGISDSIKGLTTSLVDTFLTLNDSLVPPYILPGGFIDAVGPDAKRPMTINTVNRTAGNDRQSWWPLTTGAPLSTSPLMADIDHDGQVDIVAVSDAGWLWRFEMTPDLLDTVVLWGMTGSTPDRTYRMGRGAIADTAADAQTVVDFFSYPNPLDARLAGQVMFKYELGSNATSVRVAIWTYGGNPVYEQDGLPSGKGLQMWPVSVTNLGSAVYRCRLEATFANGKTVAKTWKMAIVR